MVIALSLFLLFHPQFGENPSKEQKNKYAELTNFRDGKFVNQSPTEMDIHFWELMKELFKSKPNKKPNGNIPTLKMNPLTIGKQDSSETRLTWMGHSTFLLEMQGKIILIDPMFGERPSPVSWAGTKRYSNELPLDIEKLTYVDAVILSHDHYDHLDYQSIRKLKGKVGTFFTPLGVGNHLVKWGVEKERINELNWGENIEFEDINLICTPARHFSGRGMFDRAATLWCSWVIKGENHNIFFSGDGGYDTHFKEIGEAYGPFDISLIECGQYNNNWKEFHMMPEESVQAAIDVKSKLAMPIHWGAFTLAMHDWTDPIERFLAKAETLNLPVATPRIGESVMVGDSVFPAKTWWRRFVGEK